MDVFPTVLDLIGLPPADAQIDGQSLVPLLKDESDRSNPIYLETASVLKDEPLGRMVGVRTSDYKYFRSRKSPNEKIHLYDLKNDSTEENNLASINPEIVKEMELILSNFLVKSDVNISEELSDEETRSVEQELKKQIEITPLPDDIQYLDAYNHLIEKYVYEQTSKNLL